MERMGAAIMIALMWTLTGILLGFLVFVLTEREPEELTIGRIALQAILTQVWGALGLAVVLRFLGVL